MNKIIIGAIFLITSVSVSADYKVYSAPQKNNGGKVIEVPEKSCFSDLSSLSNGMYIVCGAGPDEVAVVNGKAFDLSPVIPLEGFSCQNSYANHAEAKDIALSMNVSVYTPYRSYLPITEGYAATSNAARGVAWRVYPNNNVIAESYSYMFQESIRIDSVNYFYDGINGTIYNIFPPVKNSNAKSPVYTRVQNSKVMSSFAYRACKIVVAN